MEGPDLSLLDKILASKKDILDKEINTKSEKEQQTKEVSFKKKTDNKKKPDVPRNCVRKQGNKKWVDRSLADWDENDYRIWVGNLGDEITENHLLAVFSKFPSFLKARVVRGNVTGKCKGYGFVSYSDPNDYLRAMKELNGKYIGKKPVVLKKSDWKKKRLK